MINPRFIVQAVGPEGGSRSKSGIRAVRAFLLHEEANTSLTVDAFLRDGVPHIEISASRAGKHHILYKGPLDALVPQA
jgi:hypothetical protein